MIFSTSDSSSAVLLLSKVRDLGNFRSGLAADQEWIGSGSACDVS